MGMGASAHIGVKNSHFSSFKILCITDRYLPPFLDIITHRGPLHPFFLIIASLSSSSKLFLLGTILIGCPPHLGCTHFRPTSKTRARDRIIFQSKLQKLAKIYGRRQNKKKKKGLEPI
jgi:hypothetical protein